MASARLPLSTAAFRYAFRPALAFGLALAARVGMGERVGWIVRAGAGRAGYLVLAALPSLILTVRALSQPQPPVQEVRTS